ncbi:MAG: hypothetical protein NT150_07975 [Bacteroidetes bacterium]|nr:hypothetical protein [Bacteroidota bacterium]
MKKLLFCVSAFALNLTVSAQNVWTGTSVPTTTTTGAVGIGTSAPFVNLQVTGSNVGPDNLFNADDNSVFEGTNALIKLYGKNLGGIDFSTYRPDANGVNTFYRNYATVRYNFNTDQLVYQNHKIGQVFTFDGDGNFGLGTAIPTAKLHVNGSLRFQGNGAGSNYVLTSVDGDGNAMWKAPDWIRSGSNISYSGGNVGIGTNDPETALQIIAPKSEITLKSTGEVFNVGQWSTTTAYYAGLNIKGFYNYHIGTTFHANSYGHFFEIANTSIPGAASIKMADSRVIIGGVTFKGNGGIDVSTRSGYSVFRVNTTDSTVYAREIKVTLKTFPDYVFEKNYELMPLNELDKYISQNKHLPNINTAADVVDNGLSLGEMQVKQMEKIEELTLYIIQQQKEMDEMKASIVKLLEKN